MLATNTNFVSVAHQRAMAMKDDSLTEESRLTKNDKEPPSAQQRKQYTAPDWDSDVPYNDLATGSTTESKAERYAAAATASLREKLASLMSAKDTQIAELQAQLAALQQGTKAIADDVLVDTNSEDNEEAVGDKETRKITEVIEEEEVAFKDHDMANKDFLVHR